MAVAVGALLAVFPLTIILNKFGSRFFYYFKNIIYFIGK